MPAFALRRGRAARWLTVSGVLLAGLGVGAAFFVAPARPAAPVPLSGATVALAAATVKCGTPSVPMYHVDGQSRLRRWSYAAPQDGSSGWTGTAIGVGWGGLTVVSGGTGVLFTIDSTGYLHWNLDRGYNGSTGESWNPASGSIIGTGWGAFGTVVSGGHGVIYAVDGAGSLRWYRYVGTKGSAAWAPGSGGVIGTGWNVFTKIVAGGSGVLYAVDPSGTLSWYEHLDPTGGTAKWANGGGGKVIGAGWSGFAQVGSMGAGIIFARDTDGTLWWYRHADPLGGSASWANGGIGIGEGIGWGGGQMTTDVSGCVPFG